MALQKYRADTKRIQPDGATVWSANWMGGPTVAKATLYFAPSIIDVSLARREAGAPGSAKSSQ